MSPADEGERAPSYCHVSGSYAPFSRSHPLNRPSRSSVSRNSGLTMAAAFV